jgi:hypothetical protein
MVAFSFVMAMGPFTKNLVPEAAFRYNISCIVTMILTLQLQ